MKTLKLKKDDLKTIQGYMDEIHGMESILSDISLRRNYMNSQVRRIIKKSHKKDIQFSFHFDNEGKISKIEIKD